MISIELTSVWFASAGNLYSQSFYRLCHANLTEQGVLQQWVQLHHITLEDITTIIRTLRSVFPHVELWFGGHQGILVASKSPLRMKTNDLTKLSPPVRSVLRAAEIEKLADLDKHLLVPQASMDAVLAQIKTDPTRLSTDDNLVLEYSTPKAIAQADTFESNVRTLRDAVTAVAKR
jgi:spermidine synthase